METKSLPILYIKTVKYLATRCLQILLMTFFISNLEIFTQTVVCNEFHFALPVAVLDFITFLEIALNFIIS